VSHLLWGLHPVCSRYLQTRPTPPLEGVNLLTVGQLLALAVNLAATFAAPGMFPSEGSGSSGGGRSSSNADSKGAYEKVASEDASEPGDLESSGGVASTEPVITGATLADGPARTAAPAPVWCGWSQAALHTGLLFGTTAALRAVTNVLSSSFTQAYNVQLVAMAGPLITALASRALIGETIPWALWPALAVAGVGEAAVVSAQASRPLPPSSVSSSSSAASSSSAVVAAAAARSSSAAHGLLVGCSLQLLSQLFSSVARVVMKTSSSVGFSPEQLMVVQ